jgi:hypothetical protein
MEISIAIIIVVIWAIAFKTDCSIDAQFYIVLASAAFLVWGTYAYLSFQNKRNSVAAYRIRRLLSKTRQGDKEWWAWLQNRIDTPLARKKKDRDDPE